MDRDGLPSGRVQRNPHNQLVYGCQSEGHLGNDLVSISENLRNTIDSFLEEESEHGRETTGLLLLNLLLVP